MAAASHADHQLTVTTMPALSIHRQTRAEATQCLMCTTMVMHMMMVHQMYHEARL